MTSTREIYPNVSHSLQHDVSYKSGKIYRVLELYSGIGGMRFALQESGIRFEIVGAMDINPVVNHIYTHNFGKQQFVHKNILSLTTPEIENMDVDLITMSPPCQPFTRVGLKKDIHDARSCSFLHFLKILLEMHKKPSYILLENVKGFEESQARQQLLQTLEKCGYVHKEFLLSPADLGIPNSRLRYYLIAKLDNLGFSLMSQSYQKYSSKAFMNYNCFKCCKEYKSTKNQSCSLAHFLEENSEDNFKKFLVPDDVLIKYWTVFDIVERSSNASCCFTKAYGGYAKGTGSVLSSLSQIQMQDIFSCISSSSNCAEKLKFVKELNLRYFTPREIANLMCFPRTFAFPENLTVRQMYKSMGNSINVHIVTSLLQLLLQE